MRSGIWAKSVTDCPSPHFWLWSPHRAPNSPVGEKPFALSFLKGPGDCTLALGQKEKWRGARGNMGRTGPGVLRLKRNKESKCKLANLLQGRSWLSVVGFLEPLETIGPSGASDCS